MRQSRAEKEKRDPPQQRARVKRAQSHESRAIDPFGNRLIENYLVLYLSL